MRETLLAVLGMLVISNTARADQPSATVGRGHADRVAFEQWIAGLSGDQRRGADFWTAQRSLTTPIACPAAPDAANADFLRGCQDAQSHLALADVRRRTEADYRQGWNLPAQAAQAHDTQDEPGDTAEGITLSDHQITILITEINQSLANGTHAGLAGQVFVYRALAAHGITSPYDQTMLTAEGLFASIKDKTPVFTALIQELNKEYQGRDMNVKSVAFANLFGINAFDAKLLLLRFPNGLR